MQFVINDVTYEAATLDAMTGRDTLDLTKQAGIGVQTLARLLGELGPRENGEAEIDPFESEPHLRALFAFLWIARRHAGERALTFDDSMDFPIVSMRIIDDPEPAPEPEPDPQ